MQAVSFESFANEVLRRAGTSRLIVGIAGAPGSGKSTLVDRLKQVLNAQTPGLADILPMDGYHFDDTVLIARNHRARKGAPHTFDHDGFAAMLARLKADAGADIAVPVFDRGLEIARAGARIIAGTTRIILAEGNYLLLDAPGWRDLHPQFDITLYLDVPETVLTARLHARWQGYGLTPQAITAKLEDNDLPNARLVMAQRLPSDYVLYQIPMI